MDMSVIEITPEEVVAVDEPGAEDSSAEAINAIAMGTYCSSECIASSNPSRHISIPLGSYEMPRNVESQNGGSYTVSHDPRIRFKTFILYALILIITVLLWFLLFKVFLK